MQALDYAYTLQGWLKGVNSDALDPSLDIGKDGYLASANPNQFVGDDQFGFSLGYYQGDYTPVGGTSAQFVASIAGTPTNLYNGNISSMLSSSRHVNNQSSVISLGFKYQYDQLNRLRHMATFENFSANNWSMATDSTASSSYEYDKNGNLKYLKRYNRDPLNVPPVPVKFDDFEYFYYNTATSETNRLKSITETGNTGEESKDFDGTSDDYEYDQIGNLISDPTEDIDKIEWTASGKVRSVTRVTGLEDSELHFKYDPTGNRIVKMVENINFFDQSLAYYQRTYYLRDAQGNIMATYNRTYAGESTQDLSMSFSVVERPIYGSSRVANFVDSVQLAYLEAGETEFSYPADNEILSHTNGYKHFELTNHLGNVMAVVSDKRRPVLNATATAIESFRPELLIAKDYYPFGMEMSGRYGGDLGTEPGDEYRFGFNGQEKDDEITGQTGSVYTAENWEYDARIGRRWNVDPLFKSYPDQSAYSAFNNNPILFIDPTGKSGEVTIDKQNKTLTISSNLILYGSLASPQLATSTAKDIQDTWNAANGKVTIDGIEYSVKFEVTGICDNNLQPYEVGANKDFKNNYFKVVDSGIRSSFVTNNDGSGANSGIFLLSDIQKIGSKTEAHEFGHGWGAVKDNPPKFNAKEDDLRGKGAPGIMHARGTLVDAQYTWDPSQGDSYMDGEIGKNTLHPEKRVASQDDINALDLENLEFDENGKANLGNITNGMY